MTNSFKRVADLLTLLLVVQYVACANVGVRPSDSVVAKANPAVKAVKAPLTVASDPLPANVQQKVAEPVQKEKVAEVVQKEEVTEVVQKEKVVKVVQQEQIVKKPVAVQQPSVAEPQKVNEEETKLIEDKKTVKSQTGHNIQGDGPFVVNAQQLPADMREEVMKKLNTQYRISQAKKLLKQKQQEGQMVQVKTDYMTTDDESFDPELAAGIAELLTRMAVEDDVGSQYVDLDELPLGLRTQVSEYLLQQQKLQDEKEMEEQLKMQQQAESIKAQEAQLASSFDKQTETDIDTLLSTLIDEAIADVLASEADNYPQRYASSGNQQMPIYASGYPQRGVYPQYGGYLQNGGYPQFAGYPQNGGYPQFTGYPGGSRYQASIKPYSGVVFRPYVALGNYYPFSQSDRPHRPQDYLMAREQLLANLYGGPVSPKPLPFRTVTGPVSPKPMPFPTTSGLVGNFWLQKSPFGYREDLKPEDQLTPLATYYAYYRQLFESQADKAGSKYGQSARIQPAVQQPRPYQGLANYQIPRYFK